ncbi:hypothetical protein SISNIDRAFT_449854 [Sistotremastrum niveocremeum HHB9708]|uniref:ATP synthase subunit K, mitochondrial n=2 Tax=Sistotremastraceae TaxID=3402574 RepID=A0A164YPW4_9AGAM|nr:hypothetical protein SISNIDRAFT_449854 [Sistotremastrum niveocremeum HHB9708]KZT41634.1 hypothetical protein SISSUDRAFT_1042754 [Sistotremastrum suecicum HHB10207 ss-3]
MSYQILGRAIKSEYIAIGTILSTVGIALAASGGEKKKASQPESLSQKFGASSSEEENFIKNFIAEAEKADGGKH